MLSHQAVKMFNAIMSEITQDTHLSQFHEYIIEKKKISSEPFLSNDEIIHFSAQNSSNKVFH